MKNVRTVFKDGTLPRDSGVVVGKTNNIPTPKHKAMESLKKMDTFTAQGTCLLYDEPNPRDGTRWGYMQWHNKGEKG